MGINTTYRTTETEIMDDFLLEGEELRDALDKIAAINTLLGGNKLTVKAVKRFLDRIDTQKTITIADVGCGNGDMLRLLANYARKRNITLELTGIDANRFTIDYAAKLSENYPNIHYVCLDIFEEEFERLQYDIILCTLTLHHFKDDAILKIMKRFYDNTTTGVIINDLHRSKIAYRLFQVISTIFGLNRMSTEDGLVSILRGFKRQDLEAYSKQLGFKNYNITWRWAFRYEWIINKI
jgi:2-polyprenyl-3-methyl-5-hydroxy-6-metoxy-1,4-benzoquinol methylase